MIWAEQTFRRSRFSPVLIAVWIVGLLVVLSSADRIAAQNGSTDVAVVMTGDVMLGRGVAEYIKRRGADYPFELVRPEILRADLAIANLESPLTRDCRSAAEKKYVFHGDPKMAGSLARAGFDVVSLANNHAADCGPNGIDDTVAALRDARIAGLGNGGTTIIESRGVKIGVAAFSSVPGADSNVADSESVAATVIALRAKSDAVIVSFHWGTEYSPVPDDTQRRLAQAAAESGADLIVGHHPHVLQGFEWITTKEGRKTLVAYSIGNFVFDPPSRIVRETAESLILTARFGRDGLRSAEIRPVVIEGRRPRPARTAEAAVILDRIKRRSEPLGTSFDGNRLPHPGRSQSISLVVDLDRDGTAESVELDPNRDSTLTVRARGRADWSDVPAKWKPWKLLIADVDGDGLLEMAVGVRKGTKFFPVPHNCLFIYGWVRRSGGFPVWLGSSLARPFDDYLFADLDGRPGDELVALERRLDGRSSTGVYKWNGFGFTKEFESGSWVSAKLVSAGNGRIEIDTDGGHVTIPVGMVGGGL